MHIFQDGDVKDNTYLDDILIFTVNNLEKLIMHKQQTILSFLTSVLKPYKWWYLLMLQAPFANAIFPLIYNYAIKLLIDLFALNSQITINAALYPVFLFVGINAWLEICWRIHNFASWKSMPYIMQDVMNKVYVYVSNHSYQFFQDNLMHRNFNVKTATL